MNKEHYLHLRRELAEQGMLVKSNRLGTLTLAFEITLLLLSIGLLAVSTPWSAAYLGGELLLGLSLFRCFVITHECGHGTLFKTKWINTAAGSVTGMLCQVPYICWRNVHFEHHKWVGIVDKDPTSAGLLDAKKYSPVTRSILSVFWKLRLPLAAIGGVIAAFWLYPFKQGRAGHKANVISGAVSLVITITPVVIGFWAFGSRFMLTYWLPAMLIFFVWFECINLTHHSGLYPYISDTHPQAIPLHAQDAHCRTAVMPSWLSMLLCYHFNLHTEHHLYPTVPWHRLPDVMKALRKIPGETFNDVDMLDYMSSIRARNPFEAFVDTVPDKI